MSILNPVPREQLGTRFTHYGWFCGVVPIYVGNILDEAPLVAERNGIPEWTFSLVGHLYSAFAWCAGQLAPYRDINVPIVITGAIEPTQDDS